MDKFEYKIANAPDLNKLGKEGWELVSVIVTHTPGQREIATYYFKRKLIDEDLELINE